MKVYQLFLITHPVGYDPKTERHLYLMNQRRYDLFLSRDKPHLLEILTTLVHNSPYS